MRFRVALIRLRSQMMIMSTKNHSMSVPQMIAENLKATCTRFTHECRGRRTPRGDTVTELRVQLLVRAAGKRLPAHQNVWTWREGILSDPQSTDMAAYEEQRRHYPRENAPEEHLARGVGPFLVVTRAAVTSLIVVEEIPAASRDPT